MDPAGAARSEEGGPETEPGSRLCLRNCLILASFHVAVMASAVTAAFWAESRWEILAKDVVDLGILAAPIQYLVKPVYLTVVLLFSGVDLFELTSKRSRRIALQVFCIDVVVLLLLLWFLKQVAWLELPFLPFDQQMEHLLRELRK